MSAERRNLPAVVEAVAAAKASSLRSTLAVPAVIADAGDHATRRFLEFFAAQIRNKNTRMTYYRAVCHFFAWVEQHRIGEFADIEPIHERLQFRNRARSPMQTQCGSTMARSPSAKPVAATAV